MAKPTLGVGITGSFCTLSKTLQTLSELSGDYNLIPILSYSVRDFDTRFYKAEAFREDVEAVCDNPCLTTIQEAEPIGPKSMLDALLVLPCTGNTLAKLAKGLTDTPVAMAAKAHIRNCKPLVLAVSTNDGLGASFQNIAELYNKKFVYFVPFRQDDTLKKPNSLVADFSKVQDTLNDALNGKQIQPLLIG